MPTLEITTMIGCPMACTFCPQDKLTANYKSDKRALSLSDFQVVLSKVPRHVRIDFSGMSEPWANRYATDMLAHVLRDGRRTAVYTTLQGMHDPDRVAALLSEHESQVEAVIVHLPDVSGNMRGFRGGQRYDDALAVFRGMEDAIGTRLSFMTMDDSDKTAPGVGPASLTWSALNRAGNLDHSLVGEQVVEDVVRHSVPVTCTYSPFYDQNVLLPNCDVLLCCMDYSCKHVLGNLLESDYYDLFKGDAMGHVTSENMRYGDVDTICRQCSRARKHDLVDGAQQFWTWDQ